MPEELDPQEKSSPSPPAEKKHVYLVSYPKVVFLYPTFLAAIAAGLFMTFLPETPKEYAYYAYYVSLAFLVIFGTNLIVLSFDFPRGTSLTLFFFALAVVIGLWSLFRFNPDLLPPVYRFLQSLHPLANAAFYYIYAGLMGLIYIGVFISVQFDYWEVRPNELLHHHGILSDLERFSAPNLRIDKEITDIFEYILLRSGRLILHPSNERRAIVLENVFFISRREQEITRLLGALQVQVRRDET